MYNTKMLLLLPLALLLVMPMAIAGSGNGNGNGNSYGSGNAYAYANGNGYAKGGSIALMGSYDDVKCLTDFEKAVISSITGAVPQASNLSAWSAKLDADTAQLYAYASGNDSANFKTYLRGTYEPDVKGANAAIRDARKDYRSWNVSTQTSKGLKDSYDSAKSTYQSCKAGSLKTVGQGRVTAFGAILDKWTKKASDLSANGVDTGGMTSVISGAKATILDPLQAALSAATTGQEVRDALSGYCLANGCKNGVNYHFYAKMEAAKLQAILNSIKGNATAAGLGSEVSSAQSDLDGAQASLSAIGTSAYPEGQEKQVWDGLKDAAKGIKGIIRSMRSGHGNGTEGG